MVDPFLLPVVSVVGGVPVASSRDVAAYMEREHVLILRAVDDLVWESAPAVASQFREVAEQGGRFFWMTRQGFLMLARGLTGPNAAKRRDRYAEAFDREAHKLPHREPRPGVGVPATRSAEVATHQAGPLALAMPAAGEPLTMSSREIAELVGQGERHDNVKRTIDTLAERGIIGRPQFEDRPFTDAQGKARSEKVYLVGKRDSYVIVARLSPEFTARLVDRWQELEAKLPHSPFILDPSDPKVMLAVFGHLQHQAAAASAQAAEALSLASEKDRALRHIAAAEGVLCLTDTAKNLKQSPREFAGRMNRGRWIYRRGGKGNWLAYQDKVRAGLMDHAPVEYVDNGVTRRTVQAVVTQKGLARLAEELAGNPDWGRP